MMRYILKYGMSRKEVGPTKWIVDQLERTVLPNGLNAFLINMQQWFITMHETLREGETIQGARGGERLVPTKRAAGVKRKFSKEDKTSLPAAKKAKESNRVKGPVCDYCGGLHHTIKDCRFKAHPDGNKEPGVAWADSKAAVKWNSRAKNPQNYVAVKYLLNGDKWEGCPPQVFAKKETQKGKDVRGHECNVIDSVEETHEIYTINSNNHSNKHAFLSHRKESLKVNYLMDSGAIVGNYVNVKVYEWLKVIGAKVHRSNVVVKGVFDKGVEPSKGKVEIDISIPYSGCIERDIENFIKLRRMILKKEYLTFTITAEVIPMTYDVILGAPILNQLRKFRNARFNAILDRTEPVTEPAFGRAGRNESSYESNSLTALYIEQGESRGAPEKEGGQPDADAPKMRGLKDLLGWVPR